MALQLFARKTANELVLG